MFQTKTGSIRRRAVAMCAVCAMAVWVAGCGGVSENEAAGTVLGGATGAIIGSQFGKGEGRTAATAIGAIIGASVGREIGESMDDTSRRKADRATRHALDTAEIGTGITWENPANAGAPARGSTVIKRHGVDRQGRTCREFQQTVTIGGRNTRSYGTACRDGNGDWKLVSG